MVIVICVRRCVQHVGLAAVSACPYEDIASGARVLTAGQVPHPADVFSFWMSTLEAPWCGLIQKSTEPDQILSDSYLELNWFYTWAIVPSCGKS